MAATFGAERLVNTTTAGDQQYAGVAMNAVGQYVVVWSGNGPGRCGSGVFFQRYASGLVVDTASDAVDGSYHLSSGTSSPTRAQTARSPCARRSPPPTTLPNVGGPDRIYFNIAGSGVQTINLTSALPTITGAVTIDATTERGFAGTPLVELNGAGAGAGASGLTLGAGSSGSTIEGLVINRFGQDAIQISGSSNNVISGNFLGTDASGTVARGNLVGVFVSGTSTNNLIGGTTAAARNIISANTVDGIQLFGANVANNLVQGNYIGLDVTGTADLGNTNQGVAVFSGAHDNTIGGTVAGARNVISGNNNVGVRFTSAGTTGNLLQGNYIGANAAGTAAIGNTSYGVYIGFSAGSETIGGTAAGAGNLISGNGADGIGLDSTSGATSANTIQGNLIGTNAAGTGAIANALRGIYLNGSSSNTIGGTVAGAGNTIAYNTGAGLAIVTTSGAATGNLIEGNSIYSNGGLGIDLGNDGVTPNDLGDADSGANDGKNFPVLTSAIPTATQITIAGTYNSSASTSYRIEFFANSVPSPGTDSSGYGEGRQYLGFVTVTTDASGNASFSSTLTATVAVRRRLSVPPQPISPSTTPLSSRRTS